MPPVMPNALSQTQHSEKRLLGALLMVGAFTLIPLGEGIGKSLMASLPPLEVMCGRFTAHFLWLAPFVIFRHREKLIHEFHPRAQIIRGAFLSVAILFFVLSISVIPLARAVALSLVAPFIVAALSFAVLGERVRASHFICIAGGFGGVLLIARPDAGLEWHNIFAIICGVFYALFLLASRKLPAAPPEVGSFYVAAVGAAALLPLMFFVETKPPGAGEIAFFAVIGGVIALAHYLLALAFKYAKAAFLSLFTYWEIAAAVIIGLILHGDIPDAREWLGIAVIVFCGIMMALHGEKRAECRPASIPEKR